MDTSNHNLPSRRKRFIGRGHELESLDRALADYQLVTIVGGGGMGKTRLAMHYGESTDRFDRLIFCELTEARTVEDLTTRVAASLELDVTSATRPAQVGISLSRLGDVLLIVDNLEQVVEPAAHAIGMWMEQAPNVTFLAISREPLHLRGEYRFELAPLSKEEALELFEHRAQRSRPDFEIDEDNRRDIERIIERLDALPLAIELAACRINVLSPADILERLDEQGGLDTLSRKTRFATARHQTMHSTLQWSWDLLSERERRVLAGASVFRGGFDLDAAEAVLSTGDETWIGDIIESLSDKSLISTVPPSESAGNSGRRFELFETISYFAAKKLEPDERQAIERAHAHYYVELLEDHPVSRYLHEAGNIEQAFRASIGTDDRLAARAALAAYRLLRVRGAYHRIFEIVDRALEGDVQDPSLHYQLFEARAACCFEQGEYTGAIRDLENALDAADEADAPVSRAFLKYRKALAILAQGRPPDARMPLDEALDLAERHDSARGKAAIRIARSIVDFKLGYFDQARERLNDTLETAYRAEQYDLAAEAMVHLARCEMELGELEAAATRLEEADRTHPRGDRDFRLNLLEKRGILAWSRDDADRARRFFNQALDEEASIGDDRRLIAIRFGLSAMAPDEEAAVSPNTHLRDVLEMVRSTEDKAYRIQARTRLAAVRIRQDVCSEASRLLAQAAEEADQLGDERAAAHIRAWWGLAEAGLGNLEHSDRLLEDARQRHEDFNHDRLADDIDYYRQVANLLTDPTKQTQAQEEMATDLRAAANGRQFEPEARLWRWPCYDHLGQLAAVVEDIAESSAPEDAFCAARDGSTLVLPDGDTIDLSSREALRRIVAELARRRDTAPGRGLSVDRLLDAGWPEAKVTEDAGKSRVYTAIRNLRSKGLEDILLTGHDGYFLDPELPFEWLD